jgi:putative glycosyltransferase (TIGR04372 family)
MWRGMVNKLFLKKTLTRSYGFICKGILFLHGVWAIPAVIVIRLIRPWLKLRFGTIRCDRIGHFAADSGQQWAKHQLQDALFVDLYWLPSKTCNTFMTEIVRRNFSVHWWVRYLDYWNRLIPRGSFHCRPSSETGSRDLSGSLEKARKSFPLLKSEDDKGKKWLKQHGWRDGEHFACLLVRDRAYLDHFNKLEDGSWRYHDYRDTDISNYEPAALWLANQGVWVLRMGRKMEKPMSIKHPRIIDYAFQKDQSDFLDIWLLANCCFCISTGSGPDMVSDMYRRPLLFINYIPFRNIISWSNATHLPKDLFWESSGIELTLNEYFTHTYFTSDEYRRAGIVIKDLTPAVIQEAVQEMWRRLNKSWHDSDEDLKLQELFWQALRECPDYQKYHGYVHPEARAGTVWLRSLGKKLNN